MVALNTHFEKASLHHQEIIFHWLEEPHIREFWDNSQEHKDDILNFIHGRKQHYFYGTTQYWLGYIEDQPFSFILSDPILASQADTTDLQKKHLSKTGRTIILDFCIGCKEFIGKGLAAPILKAFMTFYHAEIDPTTDTFFIDPNENNPRAVHVYKKAGFEVVGSYISANGFFVGNQTSLMVKKLQ
jgi:RimJ/RimL family protein N-acetyltransferase